VGQKHEKFPEFRTPFPPRDIRRNPRSMYARLPQAMAQFVLKIELLSHIMGTTPILEMARAFGLRPQLWLLWEINFMILTLFYDCPELLLYSFISVRQGNVLHIRQG